MENASYCYPANAVISNWNMEKGNLVLILIQLTDPSQMRLTELIKCRFKESCAVMHTVHVKAIVISRMEACSCMDADDCKTPYILIQAFYW